MDNPSVILVGHNLTPPWDSAASSLGLGIIKTLLLNGIYDLDIVSTYRTPNIIAGKYKRVSSSILLDYEKVLYKAQWWLIPHIFGNNVKNDVKLFSIVKNILGERSKDVLIYMGAPTSMYALKALMNISRKIFTIIYVYTLIDSFTLKAFTFMAKISKNITIATTSLQNLRLLRERFIPVILLPPVIDTITFKVNEEYKRKDGLLEIGYSGPLFPERFPIRTIVSILKFLAEKYNVRFMVRGLIRHGTWEWVFIKYVEKILTSILGRERVDIRVGQLTRRELSEFYNRIDILLYLFEPSLRAEISDPPLTPLEALSCGTSVIASRGTSLDFYLEPLIGKYVTLIDDDTQAVIQVPRTHGDRHVVHEYIEKLFSPHRVYQLLTKTLITPL